MAIAKEASRAGTCLRLQVGSVLVRHGRILAIGYNGAPTETAHCLDVGCDVVTTDGKPHCQRAIHADQNALLNAAALGTSTRDAELFTTHSPCYACARLLINAGVRKVTYLNDYDDMKAQKLLKEAGLERVRFQV